MSRPKGKKSTTLHIWSDEEKAYLKEITPGRHYKDIHELMNKKFEYQFTFRQVAGAIKRYKFKTGYTGRFEKGSVPFNKGTKGLTGPNKTSFKKGNVPANHKSVGSERTDKDGYTLVKTAEPDRWELKQRIIYEKNKGKIPKGEMVIFLDGDRGNFDINNLELVSRNKLLTLNRNNLIKDDADMTRIGINIADVILKINDKKKK